MKSFFGLLAILAVWVLLSHAIGRHSPANHATHQLSVKP